MQVQVFDDSSFSGFVDDSKYSNLFGITGKAAKNINANVDRINAETAKLRADTDAKMKAIAEQDKATQDKIRQAKELEAKLQETIDKPISIVPTDMPSAPQQDPTQQGSGNPLASIPKPVLIGGGVILALVVVLLVVRR